MGDAQSVQRERDKDAEAEEQSGEVDDAPAQHNTEEKPLRISEINGKADSTITAEVNGTFEEEITAVDILSPDVSGRAKQIKDEETPLENVDINEKKSPNEADADEEEPLEIIEMDAKQNDIHDSFQRFFSNISLKLSVKRGSVGNDQIETDVSDETNKNDSNRTEHIMETAKEAECDNVEQSIDPNTQGTCDNDSTTCPTLTDVTSEDIPENAQEKKAETKEEAESDKVDTATSSPVADDEMVQKDVMCEDLNSAPTSSPETEEVVSPVKRFFTTGIFSGLRKKKKSIEDDTVERELVEMDKETAKTKDKSEDTQHDNEVSPLDIEADTVKTENKEKDPIEENLCAASAPMMDEGESPTTNSATVTTNEPENKGSQDLVQDSPLKWLLSGSSFRKVSKKQRGRKSSHEKLSDSGEHSDQLKTPATPSETLKEESPAQFSAETAGEEDGAWASFKKLLTPKKHMKRSSLTNEETQITGALGETKPSEVEQISNNGTEEGKKRKDSSVSWEAVLCGSGKKSRSRKTSDSEEETPQTEDVNKKETLESSNEVGEITAISPKQAGSPSEGDGLSTWKSFRKLVTPKKKAKDDEESKDNIQSDSEVTQEEPSFSIKKFLPGRKKKTAETQDNVSSDEADKEVASGDEDSETPAVVPLSEFDICETEVHIETQADVESHVPQEADFEPEQELLDQVAKPVVPSDSLQTETKQIQAEDDLKNEPPTAPASNEEPEDLTELFSKHHPLSDIPEEGMFTETIATPGSIAEEAVRDDTIMEDLIEITSEAITAPEHIDETEMISAVSQLSQSSNTSGNITPVPVEYDTKQTEALLQQVVETISVSPKSEPVCSEEINEAVSVETLPEVESIVADKGCPVGTGKDEKKPLDIDSQEPQSAALIAEENKDGAAEQDNQTPTQKEEQNLPHITDQVEFENEDQHQVEVETLQPVKELQAEQDATSGSEEGSDQLFQKEVLSDECTSEETITAEPKEETVALTEYKVDAKTEKPQEDAPQPDHSEEPEELDDVQMATINLEVDSVQLLEKDAILEGSPEEMFTDKTKEALEFLTHCTDAENEDMMQTDGFQVEYFEEKLLEAVQTTTLDSKEDISWLLEKEVKLQDITAEETVMDKPEEETMALAEFDVKAEMENQIQAGDAQMECAEEQKEETQPLSEYNVQEGTENRLQTDAPQTAQVGKPFDFEDSGHLLPKEAISEDIPIEETVTDKLTEKNEPLTEYNVAAETDHKLQKDAAQTEHTKDPAVLEAVQTAQTNLEENTSQLLEKELTLEDLKAQETVTDKPKEETQNVTEYDVKEGTENRLQTDAAQTEQVTEAVQAATLDLDDNSGQLLSKKVISDDIAAGEKEATQPLTEYDIKAKTENKFQRDAAQTLHTKDPAMLEAVQTAQSNLEENTSQLLEKELTLGDIQAQETVTDKPKEEKQPLSEYNVQEGTENRLQTDAAQTAQVGKPFDLEDSGHLLPKEVISEDIPIEETVTGKLKEKNEPLTEYNVAAETDHKLQKDAAQTEHTKDPAVLEAVQTALVIKEGNLQTSNESDILQAIPATENFSEVGFKPDNKDQKIDAPNTDHDQAAEVIGGVSVQSLQKEALSEKTLETEAVTDEAKEEPEPLIEASEFVAAIESDHVQDHEVVEDPSSNFEDGGVQSHDKEVISEEIPRAETFTHELTQATEGDIEPEQLAEHVTGHIQESNVNDPETETVTEEEPSMAAPAVSQTVEEVGANVLKVNEEQKTEFTPQNAQISQEDPILEVVDELQTVTAVHVSSADEASCVQVREKPVFSEATPPALLENATFKHERMYAQNLSVVQSNVEEEEERGTIPGFAAQYATVAQVITCHLKDFVASIPDPLIETKSNSYEPLIECVASQLDFKETTETATPLVKNDVTMTEGDTSVVLMNVPLVEFKDNHQIQVQVVNVDIKSAGKTVDKVLEVGITEAKEVIDVCHRSVKEVDKLSAKSEIEETLIHEENRVIIQESVLVKLEQEAIKQTDDVTEMGKTAEMELSELEEQKFEDSTVGERPEGVSAVPSKQVLKDDSLNNDKENSEDPKTKVEQSKVDVTTEEVKVYSDLKKMNEETHKTQMSQSQLVMPNVEVVVPQNTGIISSMSNVESPSSLSLEFKLNIQFGQAKEPASPPPTADRTEPEPVKETDVAEVGIEAVASEKEPNKKQKTTELVDVAVQGTKMTEPEPANIDQTERSVVTGQPQLLDVGIQTIETAESVKEVDKLSAKLEIEETLIHEENRAIIQDSTQHVAPESVLVKSEQEVKKQTDTVAEMSKTETELSEEEEQKVEDAAVGERPDGGSEGPEKEPEKKLKTLIDAFHGTEMTETEPADIDLKERSVFTSQPQLLDVGMQTVTTVEPAVQLKPIERGAAHVQLKETREKIMKKEKRQVFLGRPEQETKVEEPVKNTEEEVDQDVWMDAEEDVDYPEETEMSLRETEEPTEHQHESTQGEMSAAEPDFETAPTSTVEEDGNQQTLQQIKTFETEIEAEAFAVALEHSEAATANTAIMEWD